MNGIRSKIRYRSSFLSKAIESTGMIPVIVLAMLVAPAPAKAQSASFHDAPAEAQQEKNPYTGQHKAALAGANSYATHCAACHGVKGSGGDKIPVLAKGPTQAAPDGAIFWFITQGDSGHGMPSWSALPIKERWQLVTYLKALGSGNAPEATVKIPGASSTASASGAPSPNGPFTDYRYENPGTVHKITVQDLPRPYATKSAGNEAKVVTRPVDAWPKAPQGFAVQQYASGLDNPRLITTAPNGDFFLAEADPGIIKVFRGITADGKPEQVETFATGLKTPYGIAFYPPGPNPQWVYVGNTTRWCDFRIRTAI